MSVTVYKKTALTGGTATALDSIDGALLLDSDFAFVTVSNVVYVYILDDDLGGSESSPINIKPDTNPGNKMWVLQNVFPFTVNAKGEVINPNQPAFLAFNSGTDTDVTGDGTAYIIICDNEVFDQNADYDNANGVFYAPVTGRYLLSFTIWLSGLAGTHTDHMISLVTSNRTFYLNDTFTSNPFIPYRSISFSVITDMDAGDNAYINIIITGNPKSVDVIGHGAAMRTFFCGELVC